jgi:hypothetical protein
MYFSVFKSCLLILIFCSMFVYLACCLPCLAAAAVAVADGGGVNVVVVTRG